MEEARTIRYENSDVCEWILDLLLHINLIITYFGQNRTMEESQE